MLLAILISSLVISLISLIGIFFLSKKINSQSSLIFIFVAFAAGAMLGNALFHLLPESLEEIQPIQFSIIFIFGFVGFFIIEKITHWRHCHKSNCKQHEKPVGYLNLIGDGFHNFLDGILIAVSYIAGFEIGIATTIAILAHEVPQEIGDFSVLIYSGFSKSKAILFNFLSALLAVVGALTGFLIFKSSSLIPYVLPIIAGSLVYIASADLIPELHKNTESKKSIILFLSFILGLSLLYFLKIIF